MSAPADLDAALALVADIVVRERLRRLAPDATRPPRRPAESPEADDQ